MATSILYLLAGPNGAGKSTLYHAAVADGLIPVSAEFVNADLHEASQAIGAAVAAMGTGGLG